MEKLKTKQDVMMDRIDTAKTLFAKAFFYPEKAETLEERDILEIKIQIILERISDILSNVYYEVLQDAKKFGFYDEVLCDYMAEKNHLLKSQLGYTLLTNNGVSFWKQVLAHYKDQPDELSKVVGITLLALPEEHQNILSQANFLTDNFEEVCENAKDIIDAQHKEFMERDIMPFVTAPTETYAIRKQSLDLLFRMPNITFEMDEIKALYLAAKLMYKVRKDEYEPILKRYKQVDSTPGRK